MQAAFAMLCAVACFTIADAAGLSCPVGWLPYSVSNVVIKCYYVVGVDSTGNTNSQYASDYFRAHEICYNIGGRLAMIRNQTDQDGAVAAIKNVASFGSYPAIWIDGQDMTNPGTPNQANTPLTSWFYTNGRSFTYSNWNSGEPNNWNAQENCASIYVGSPYNWNDITCNSIYPMLCERTF